MVSSEAVTGNDEASRKQLVRAGEAMVAAGLSVVLNRAGTKVPLCTLTAVERKRADQEARDLAAGRGDANWERRTHRCGLAHAISDMKTATRVLTRLSKRERFNLGVEPRASRVLIVDLDTARQAAEFALRCGQDRPPLTVRSPGQRDGAGNWVHRDGGHIWFDVPADTTLPLDDGVYTDAAGWSAVWGEHQVLVPPSARVEGPYVLVGSMHPLPDWLRDLVIAETGAKRERREESRRRRASTGPSAIDDWAANTPWSDILSPDGWVETGLTKNCGCPQWTAPGDHASPESATAHEPGCSMYVCERGHGPLRVWTDNPSESVAAAMAEYGTRTLTKIQVLTHTEGGGRMGQTLDGLGIERTDGPTVLSSSFGGWSEDSAPAEPTTTPGDPDEPTEDDDDEADEVDEPSICDPEMLFERKVRREYEHELVRRAALDRITAADAPPLRVWRFSEFLAAPQPVPLVRGMLYRDSLSRMYGAPGGGKSFLAIDLALSIALGRFWGGVRLKAEPVVYVMAEGQAVNNSRARAWVSKHGADLAPLEDRFITVPDAVLLTEAAAAPFVATVAAIRPALVVLDTKNAMMVGEENSATDFAVLRRVLDQIRKAADCCVMLVDHTGYGGTRARGSSAGVAAMDTEIRVVMSDDERPALVTAEVTRDKASEAGAAWAFRLMPEHPAAVLVPTEVPDLSNKATEIPVWTMSLAPVPNEIVEYRGQGSSHLETLARLMMHDAGRAAEPSRIGLTRSEAAALVNEAAKVVPEIKYNKSGVIRAWSVLQDLGWIEPANEKANEVGRHVWVDKARRFQDPSGGHDVDL